MLELDLALTHTYLMREDVKKNLRVRVGVDMTMGLLIEELAQFECIREIAIVREADAFINFNAN